MILKKLEFFLHYAHNLGFNVANPLGFNFCHFQPSAHISSNVFLGSQFKREIANELSAITLAISPSLLLENL